LTLEGVDMEFDKTALYTRYTKPKIHSVKFDVLCIFNTRELQGSKRRCAHYPTMPHISSDAATRQVAISCFHAIDFQEFSERTARNMCTKR
jgi:hypothetical protein